jgi:hypothetical protein
MTTPDSQGGRAMSPMAVLLWCAVFWMVVVWSVALVLT